MVHPVYALIKQRMVHQPVHPVEIGVVKENNEHSSRDIIQYAMIGQMPVYFRIDPSLQGGKSDSYYHRREY
jgi:hypothetical protein